MITITNRDLFRLLFLFQCTTRKEIDNILRSSGFDDETQILQIATLFLTQRNTLLTRYTIFKSLLEKKASTEFPSVEFFNLTTRQAAFLVRSISDDYPGEFTEEFWIGVGVNLVTNNSVGAMARLFSGLLETTPDVLISWMNDPAGTLKTLFA